MANLEGRALRVLCYFFLLKESSLGSMKGNRETGFKSRQGKR